MQTLTTSEARSIEHDRAASTGRTRRGWYLVVPLLLLLAACGGGGGGSSSGDIGDGGDGGDGGEGSGGITTTEATLDFAELDELESYLQKGLSNSSEGLADDALFLPPGVEADFNFAEGSGEASGGERSQSNVQEAGVAEADRMLSRGKLIYAIAAEVTADGNNNGDDSEIAALTDGSEVQNLVRIMQMGEDPRDLTELARLTPPNSGSDEAALAITGLYLDSSGTTLAMVGGGWEGFWGDWFRPLIWGQRETRVWFADVTDPSAATFRDTLRLEGGLVASRVVDDVLYLVTRYYPSNLVEPVLEIDNERERVIDEAGVRQLLPRERSDNDEEWRPLPVEGCLVDRSTTPRGADIIALTAIDLADPDHPHQSRCYAGSVESFYASTQSIYLATTDWRSHFPSDEPAFIRPFQSRTLIHKFAFDGLDIDYRGSADIPGRLTRNGDAQAAAFRFSEQGQDLRVVTQAEDPGFFEPFIDPPLDEEDPSGDDSGTDDTALSSPVVVSILREPEGGGDLELVSVLPNEARPEAIGLEGEQLYATRFAGDTLYLVTFRVIDPLYVIDLADPADPQIRGSLKVEGFSDYLHPVDENLLIGIGKDAVPDENGEFRGAWYQGVKVALIDVSDPQNPIETTSMVIGERGSEASVLADHLAFASVRGDERMRFAFSVNLHDTLPDGILEPEHPSFWYEFTHHGLYRFEVDRSNAQLNMLDPLLTGSEQWSYRLANDRALIIDDAVHLLHRGRFWSQDWSGSEAIVGAR